MSNSKVYIKYGDRSYCLEIDEQIEARQSWRKALHHLIVSKIYAALLTFHADEGEKNKTIAKMNMAIRELAFDRPDLVDELRKRGLL